MRSCYSSHTPNSPFSINASHFRPSFFWSLDGLLVLFGLPLCVYIVSKGERENAGDTSPNAIFDCSCTQPGSENLVILQGNLPRKLRFAMILLMIVGWSSSSVTLVTKMKDRLETSHGDTGNLCSVRFALHTHTRLHIFSLAPMEANELAVIQINVLGKGFHFFLILISH